MKLLNSNLHTSGGQMVCNHRNDSLYPRSVYRCDECGEMHGTRAVAGAVNWQCPNELIAGRPKSHAPFHQTYIGFSCVFCGELVNVDSPEFRALYPRYVREAVNG